MSATKAKVVALIAEALRLDDAEIAILEREAGYATLKKWTSAKHAEIVVAVEDAFGIEIEEREIPRLNTVAKIVAYVDRTAG